MLQAWDYYRRVYNKIDQQFDKLRDLGAICITMVKECA